jgi:Transposase
VAAAWQGTELLRTVYAADLAHARDALERFYRWADGVGVGGAVAAGPYRQGLGSRNPRLPRDQRLLQRPTEAMNLLIKKVKRVGHGFRNFTNYRLRLLLHCGVTWQTRPTASLRGRSPRLLGDSAPPPGRHRDGLQQQRGEARTAGVVAELLDAQAGLVEAGQRHQVMPLVVPLAANCDMGVDELGVIDRALTLG